MIRLLIIALFNSVRGTARNREESLNSERGIAMSAPASNLTRGNVMSAPASLEDIPFDRADSGNSHRSGISACTERSLSHMQRSTTPNTRTAETGVQTDQLEEPVTERKGSKSIFRCFPWNKSENDDEGSTVPGSALQSGFPSEASDSSRVVSRIPSLARMTSFTKEVTPQDNPIVQS